MWPARIIAEWSVIAAAFALATLHPLAWWPAALVIGTRQHALMIVGHWAAHGLTPWPRLTAWLGMAPLGVSVAAYKRQHWAHHAAVGVRGSDPECSVVDQYPARWAKPRWRDSALDALGLHADEAVSILRIMSTPTSIAFYLVALAAALAWFGWIVLLWPAASVTGLMLAHRRRARTEHDHVNLPGVTLITEQPALIARLIYLPHYTWRHFEHHRHPALAVWRKRS